MQVFAPPRSVYVHVPFCRHRCGYCDFTVVEDRLDLESSFLQAIETELSWLKSPQPVDTIFIGGGTPTEMTPTGLAKLLELLGEWFPREPGKLASESVSYTHLTLPTKRIV